MGNAWGSATGKVIAGFVKEVEATTEIESAWKISDSQLIVSLLVAYSHNDIKDLQLKEAFKVDPSVKLSYPHSGHTNVPMFKCSVDSELGLLGMEGDDWFGVVDMATKKELWSLNRTTSSAGQTRYGFQTHQWLNIDHQKYVSVQTGRNHIQMFKVTRTSDDNGDSAGGDGSQFQFEEDKKFDLIHTHDTVTQPTINFCDFDRDCKHIFLITDNSELQKRAVDDINNVMSRMPLTDGQANGSGYRNFRLSADGKYCAIGCGDGKKYFYIADMENEIMHSLKSEYLSSTYVPRFINGDTDFLAVADLSGHFEIWDLEKKASMKRFEVKPHSWIRSAIASHNVLAIGTEDRRLRLYDIRTWECFRTEQFQCYGNSLHLTDDLKYVTFAGQGNQQKEQCVVLELRL